jgi:hypothetical protein
LKEKPGLSKTRNNNFLLSWQPLQSATIVCLQNNGSFSITRWKHNRKKWREKSKHVCTQKVRSGVNVLILKKILQKTFWRNYWRFLLKFLLFMKKSLIVRLVFKKNANFFAEDLQ